MFYLGEKVKFQKLTKFITKTSTMPPLGIPRKIKISLKHDCSLGSACKITVNTSKLHVKFPCYYKNYVAILEMIVSSAKLSRRFDAV